MAWLCLSRVIVTAIMLPCCTAATPHLDDRCGVGQASGFYDDCVQALLTSQQLVEDANEVATHCGVGCANSRVYVRGARHQFISLIVLLLPRHTPACLLRVSCQQRAAIAREMGNAAAGSAPVQHTHPLFISKISSLVSMTSASSMPTSPNSFCAHRTVPGTQTVADRRLSRCPLHEHRKQYGTAVNAMRGCTCLNDSDLPAMVA
jgi:hypothetical protein